MGILLLSNQWRPFHTYDHGCAAPVYSQGYAYQPTCYTRKVRQVVDYDTVVIRRVKVCE